MKRLVLIIAAIAAFAFSSFAQLTASDSRGISIQGIARDNNGGIYASAAITILITVNNGSSVVYQEQQTGIMTDVAGVFSTNIGIAPGGPNTLTVMKGTSFSAVDFNVGSLSVQVQVQVNSGALVTVGTFALQSVPYAKLATMATNASNATNAIHATNADNATNATHATNADNATNATTAVNAANGVPIGTIIAYAGNIHAMFGPVALGIAGDNWIYCDGRIANQKDWPDLFNAIGFSWGKGSDNGATTFNIPDLRGYFMRGTCSDAIDHDPEVSSRTAVKPGGNTGNAVATYQADAFKSHKHIQGDANANPTASYDVGTTPSIGNVNMQSGTNSTTHPYTSTEGGSDYETRPKNVTVNYIIKAK